MIFAVDSGSWSKIPYPRMSESSLAPRMMESLPLARSEKFRRLCSQMRGFASSVWNPPQDTS